MPRRRTSLRAIARMKRENRDLRAVLEGVKQGYWGTRVSKLTLSSVQDAEIKTAHALGFTTLIRDDRDGAFSVSAIAIGNH